MSLRTVKIKRRRRKKMVVFNKKRRLSNFIGRMHKMINDTVFATMGMNSLGAAGLRAAKASEDLKKRMLK